MIPEDGQPKEYENEAVQNTLLSSYCPPLIAEARRLQDELLLSRYRGRRLSFADIGCGDGYHGSLFAPSSRLYHGFEIAPAIAEIARKRWRDEGLSRAEVYEGDVARAELQNVYDVAWCLYFTPGNFRDRFDSLDQYTDAYLNANPAFIAIVQKFLSALQPKGSMWLTVYRDVPEAEASQRDFYEKTGQHVITPEGLRFVATKENFWSVRWSRESMLSNLSRCGIRPPQVTFHELNKIAWLVEIQLRGDGGEIVRRASIPRKTSPS